MELTIIGAGYVGLTTGAVLAELGHVVTIVDCDRRKVDRLKEGIMPFYEPGLDGLVSDQLRTGRLQFENEITITNQTELVMVCVGTPPNEDGSPDLGALTSVVDDLAKQLLLGQIVLTKSSVPPGTNSWICKRLSDAGIREMDCPVVSNPEFLREGTAIEDTRRPSRMVFGIDDRLSLAPRNELLERLYELYRGIHSPLLVTNWEGAELVKYGSNAFLAAKISYINELSCICDAYGADIRDVSCGIGMDPRIGPDFLKAGLGYGGSCLPKDLSALAYCAESRGVTSHMFEEIGSINERQMLAYAKQFLTEIDTERSSKINTEQKIRVAVWGIAFKPETDDTRMSPAITFMKQLLAWGVEVHAYDPMAIFSAHGLYLHDDPYAALLNADGLAVVTDWPVFAMNQVNWAFVKETMRGSVVLDARNIYHFGHLEKYGLIPVGIGRPLLQHQSIISEMRGNS